MLFDKRAYLRPIVILALYAGMRRGEILNLEWWQVDFGNNKLVVTKTNVSLLRCSNSALAYWVCLEILGVG